MVAPDELDQFLKDPKTACKYGIHCYQKNSDHLQKYKHPPKQHSSSNDKEKESFPHKRPKLDLKDDSKLSEKQDATSSKLQDSCERNALQNTSDTGEKSLKNLSDSDTETCTEEYELPNSGKDFNDLCFMELKADTSSNELYEEKEDARNDLAQASSTNDSILNKTAHTEDRLTIVDPAEFILEKFLVKMPPDFFSFWDYCKSLKPDNPTEAFANIGLHLVGPYEACSEKFSKHEKSPEEYLIHWRYFYDPPEFQTVIKGPDANGYHIGYFRDDPRELPVFVGCNSARLNGEITIMGDNIFAAVSTFIETTLKSCDPFKKMSLTKTLSQIKAKAADLKLSLSDNSDKIKERKKKVLASTFNKAGLVVPYNRKTQVGYRHLYMSNKDLQKLLDRVANASEQQRIKVLSELQEVLTATSIATDEGDFGTGLELGWNILAHGVDSVNTTIDNYLNTAYSLLNRHAFGKIVSAHMANRRKGTNLSIL